MFKSYDFFHTLDKSLIHVYSSLTQLANSRFVVSGFWPDPLVSTSCRWCFSKISCLVATALLHTLYICSFLEEEHLRKHRKFHGKRKNIKHTLTHIT